TRIACDSGSTQTDWREVIPEARGREEVVHLGLQAKTLSRNQRKLTKRRPFDPFQASYLLHVGNDAWYKNRKAVVEGFLAFLDEHPDDQLQLALVGPPVNERLLSPQHRKSLPQFASRIHILTDLDDNDLSILYKNAFAFAFPSLLEGFGWPPLEAQAHGCPVIASRAGSLEKILGDSVLTIDPAIPQELCEAIARLRTHPEECRRWSEIGRKNAARFPFSKTVDRYEEIYQRLAHAER
ncbi:MAG: glycosyltransferase, partial [Opitutales bacterium]